MTFEYQEDGSPNGSYRPARINYTGNSTAGLSPAYRVNFYWDARPANERVEAYVAGGLVRETNRLNRVETEYNEPNVGWRLVRRYQLSYNTSGVSGRSRLAAIQECDRNANCLAPTVIGWQEGTFGWSATPVGLTSLPTSAIARMPLDMNGDGRTDYVFFDTSTNYWRVMFANSDGTHQTPVNIWYSAVGGAIPMDVDGDGKMDLLVADSSNNKWWWVRHTANGSFTGVVTALSVTSSMSTVGSRSMDVNGDGLDDVVFASSSTAYVAFNQFNPANPSSPNFSAPTAAWTTSQFTSIWGGISLDASKSELQNADFDGDGRDDLLLMTREDTCGGEPSCPSQYVYTWTILRSTGSAFVASGTAYSNINAPPSDPMLSDLNGDGLTDLVYSAPTTPNGSTRTWRYWLSGGGASNTGINTNGMSGFISDCDADGYPDLVSLTQSGSFFCIRSNGSGLTNSTVPMSAVGSLVHAADADGDGLPDFVGVDANSNLKTWLHRGVLPDLVTTIADGFGNTVSVTYAPLTDSSVYTAGSGAVFPEIDMRGPMYVVKKYSASDGIGGSYTVPQSYTQGRVHVRGRGFLGFRTHTSTDGSTTEGRTGIRTTSTFRQDYPYVGFAEKVSIYQPGGSTLISETSNTPSQLVTSAESYNGRTLPYVSQSVQKTYEVGGPSNGLPVVQVTSATSIDTNGNPVTSTTTTADMTGSNLVYTTSTNHFYEDATCAWRGFATRQEVTNTAPNQSSQTRTVQYIRDTANPLACRVYQEIVEPNDATGTLKVTTTIGYDTFGHPVSQVVSAAGIENRTTTTNYGSQGVFPLSVSQSVSSTFNHAASKTYDYALGVPKTATEPNGLMMEWQHDGFGRVTWEKHPDNTKTIFVYSGCTVANNYCGDNRLRYQVEKRELDANDGVIRTSRKLFDSFGRALYAQAQTLSGAFTNVATNYDALGRAYQQSQPYFSGFPAHFTTVSYDPLGRAIQDERRVSDADTGTQTTQYSYNRLVHGIKDANNKTTTKQFNALGQVVKVTDAAGGVTEYEYDPFGNLRKTKDPLGNEIVNVFNIRGFKTSTKDPDMGTWTYTYYPTGELWTQQDAKNQTVTFTYDHASRPKTRVESEGTTTFNYGISATEKNIGKLASVSSPGGYSESYVYDSLGRLQDATTNADATSFVVSNSYNATTGLLESVTYPTSTSAVPGSRFKVKYEYEYGLLKRTRDFNTPSTVYWEQIATNAAGQTLDEQFGNGLHSYSTYDSITGLLGARTTGGSAQVQNLTYQWDKLGNLSQRQDLNLGLTEDFSYDDLYRLDSSKLNGVANLALSYDATGNIKTKTGVGTYSYPTSSATSVRPHAVTSAGGKSYGYDANGNMTSREGSPITWYSYNLPNRIDKGSNYSQFFYGADRSRYKQVAFTAAGGSLPAGTETTIYVGGLFEKVTKPSGVIEYKHYILAGGEAVAIRTLRSNAANDTRYLHKDHLGSVDAITNESGSVVQRLSYDAFGKRRNATAWSGALAAGDWTNIAAITHRGFTFHEALDNLDLVHMNGRVYDPNLGRFISADPFIQAPLMSQSLNRYSYVMNNPLSMVDPSGYSWVSKAFRKAGRWFDKAFGVVGQIVASVVVVAVAVAACWGSNLTGCGPAATAAAAQLAVIWGSGGSSGRAPARGPPLSGPGTFGRSSGTYDWARNHGINGNAFGASIGSDTTLILPSLPFELVDWFAGFGDALTFGLTRYARDVSGIGSVDTSSGNYSAGHFNGTVASVLFSAGSAVATEVVAMSRAAAARISGMLDVNLADKFARGTGKLGAIISSTTNAAGGTVVTASGRVVGSDFAGAVNSAMMRGESVTILSGVHGEVTGAIHAERAFFEADKAMFGHLEGVTVLDVTRMTPSEISSLLQSPGTTIGAFCESGICLAPFW